MGIPKLLKLRIVLIPYKLAERIHNPEKGSEGIKKTSTLDEAAM